MNAIEFLNQNGVSWFDGIAHRKGMKMSSAELELLLDIYKGEGNGFHFSDCATHNEPAYPNGECNCAEIWVGLRDKIGELPSESQLIDIIERGMLLPNKSGYQKAYQIAQAIKSHSPLGHQTIILNKIKK